MIGLLTAPPTDTQFDTVEINRQYDGLADFPLYPLNVIADLNAVLGMVYVHLYDLDVSLPADPTKSKYYQGNYGRTDYYFFETQDLPLFGPLRTLGVPESLIDVVEPFFRVIVDLGYDRSIRPWEPTPARLIPMHDPVTVAGDLVTAIGEGFNNALAIIGLQPLPSTPGAPAEISITADVSDQATTRQLATQSDEATTGQQAADTDEATTPTVSTSEPWKRAGRHETPRPVVRGPLGVYGQQIRRLQHSGDADAPTPQTAAAGDVATTAGPSSRESSSVRSSPGSARSLGGDTDGS